MRWKWPDIVKSLRFFILLFRYTLSFRLSRVIQFRNSCYRKRAFPGSSFYFSSNAVKRCLSFKQRFFFQRLIRSNFLLEAILEIGLQATVNKTVFSAQFTSVTFNFKQWLRKTFSDWGKNFCEGRIIVLSTKKRQYVIIFE